MDEIWDHGSAAVRELMEALNRDTSRSRRGRYRELHARSRSIARPLASAAALSH